MTGRAVVVALLGGLWLAAGTSLADSIHGVLDGEEREWFILQHGDDSNASFIDLGGMYSVDLVGFVEPDSWSSQEALSISMTIVDGDVTDYDVLHLVGPTALPPVYTSEGGEVRLMLETFEVHGKMARVTGQVEGRLALQESLGVEPDLEQGLDLAVEFDVEASRVEF